MSNNISPQRKPQSPLLASSAPSNYSASYPVQSNSVAPNVVVNAFNPLTSSLPGVSTLAEIPPTIYSRNPEFMHPHFPMMNENYVNRMHAYNGNYIPSVVPLYIPTLESIPSPKNVYFEPNSVLSSSLALPTSEMVAYDDMPSLNSTTGYIILCTYVMLVLSLFICLSRPDFNFVIYLIGYYIWCIDANINTYEGCGRTAQYVQQYSLLLCTVSVFDITYLFMAFSTWTCDSHTNNGNTQIKNCFVKDVDLKLRLTYSLHLFILYLSLINLVIKFIVIFLNFSWIQQQKKKGMPIDIIPPEVRCATACANHDHRFQ